MPIYSQKDASYRVFLDSKQGGRKYMEDVVCIREHKSEDGESDFVYFAIFDGHGGASAARFAREHLLDEMKKQKGFWTKDEDQVSKAIKEAFVSTHKLMWKNVGSWPKTVTGLPSTSGTTASIVLIKNGKLYVAHVGDSAIVIGEKNYWKSTQTVCATIDHKPESVEEKKRIEESGGQVMAKAGVPRVVWHRPKPTHKGPVRRSTHIDDIPFLAVARALGDLWSYNSQRDTFVVSPEPDVAVYNFSPNKQKFIILASDGLWNMVKAEESVGFVDDMEEKGPLPYNLSYNPAKKLVQLALDKWAYRHLRADNTSVISVNIDPPMEDDVQSRSSRVSSSSTIRLSEAETEVLDECELELGADVEIEAVVENSPVMRSHYFSTIAPSPRHIGLCRSNAVMSSKHIHALSGKTPSRVYAHSHPNAPRSAPPKLHRSISGSIKKGLSLHKTSGESFNRSSHNSSVLLNDSHRKLDSSSSSPSLTGVKRKFSSDNGNTSISKISPLQASTAYQASPNKRKNSTSSLDCCGSAVKKLKRSSTSNSDSTSSKKPTSLCYQKPLQSGDSESGSVEVTEVDAADDPAMLKADSPKMAITARSPLKVDTCPQSSPSIAVISPIWPSCLDKDIDMETNTAEDLCNLPVSGSKLCHAVLRENNPKTSFVSLQRSTFKALSRKTFGSQNNTRLVAVRRKTPTQGPRIRVKSLRLRSKRPTTLRNCVHRTRLQVKATISRKS